MLVSSNNQLKTKGEQAARGQRRQAEMDGKEALQADDAFRGLLRLVIHEVLEVAIEQTVWATSTSPTRSGHRDRPRVTLTGKLELRVPQGKVSFRQNCSSATSTTRRFS